MHWHRVPYLAHAKKTPFHCCHRIRRCIADTWAPRAVVLAGALLLMLALVLHMALPKHSHASRSAVVTLVLFACMLFAGYCVYHQCCSEETDGGDAQYHTELTAEGGRVFACGLAARAVAGGGMSDGGRRRGAS